MKTNPFHARRARLLMSTALLLAATAASGCLLEGEDGSDYESVGVGASENGLYYLSTRLQTARPIRVCWTSTPPVADAKTVQDTITAAWPSFANVSFSGWAACPSPMGTFAGIAIKPGTVNVVRNGLGVQADGVSDMELDFSASPQTVWDQCTRNSLSRSACIAATAIHEFGHSLAFAHEHRRPDNEGKCLFDPRLDAFGDTTFGDFDRDSILNYCVQAPYGIRPSVVDIQGAISVYGMAPALVATTQSY
jgi:hypothetical protein